MIFSKHQYTLFCDRILSLLEQGTNRQEQRTNRQVSRDARAPALRAPPLRGLPPGVDQAGQPPSEGGHLEFALQLIKLGGTDARLCRDGAACERAIGASEQLQQTSGHCSGVVCR